LASNKKLIEIRKNQTGIIYEITGYFNFKLLAGKIIINLNAVDTTKPRNGKSDRHE
jgi:hypothetical protein